jgi:hypothetical protein
MTTAPNLQLPISGAYFPYNITSITLWAQNVNPETSPSMYSEGTGKLIVMGTGKIRFMEI